MMPEQNPFAPLRFHNNRQQRMVMPLTRSNPRRAAERTPIDAQSARPDNFINCPRCGADNRNWLQILNRPSAPVKFELLFVGPLFVLAVAALILAALLIFLNPSSEQYTHFIQAQAVVVSLLLALSLWKLGQRLFNDIGVFENLSVSLLALAAALLAFLATMALDKTNLFTRAIPLAAFVFLAGLLPPVIMTRQWQAIFQWRRQQRYLPVLSSRRSPLLLVAIGLVLILAVGVPLFAYMAVPVGINLILDRMSTAEIETPHQAIISLNDRLEDWLKTPTNANTQSVQELNNQLVDYLAHTPIDQPETKYAQDMLKLLPSYLTQLPNEVTAAVQARISDFTAYVDAPTEAPFRVPNDVPRRFLAMWVSVVGLSSVLGIASAMSSVEKFVGQVMEQVSPPIYYSIANMTRVVAWEAGRALDNVNHIDHVQWVDVQRNELGGIDLIGLYRDTPEFDAMGQPLYTTVRAQRFTICTDMWGHIEFAEVRDMRVPPTVGTPYFAALPLSVWQTEVNVLVPR
ncbi:MAG: hypothetical protein H6660_14405 [Ardenticatenaceae bacterium]|nr:hypothetical protein [Ardenticatenaceae bacterium]